MTRGDLSLPCTGQDDGTHKSILTFFKVEVSYGEIWSSGVGTVKFT